ncbi:MAG: hypothetical protein EA350_15315 [Gemmatimonadales bacterium]|nr:MAG: hypothetical protein EA350_15315 [Gemmatimonadales bacterium]
MDDVPPHHPEDPEPGEDRDTGAHPERGTDPGPASDRLRLEVELLTPAAAIPPATRATDPSAALGDPVPRTVLLGIGDADLRAYVRECLRGNPALRVVEPDVGEHALDAVQRLNPALLIAEPGTVGTMLPRAVPLLLLAQELPQDTEVRPSATLALLTQPFNARRLLDAVEMLLGPPEAP